MTADISNRDTSRNTDQTAANQTAANQDRRHDFTGQAVTSSLHPRVYTLVIGLAAWLVCSVWIFAAGGLTNYLLVVVTGFIVIAVGLPLILSRVGRNDPARNRAGTTEEKPMPFHDWVESEFDTWQGRLSARQAAVQILLPIAAVAFGMTAFGIALLLAEHGV